MDIFKIAWKYIGTNRLRAELSPTHHSHFLFL